LQGELYATGTQSSGRRKKSEISRTLAAPGVFSVLAFAMAGIAARGVAPLVFICFVLKAMFSNPSTSGAEALLGLMNFDGAGNVRYGHIRRPRSMGRKQNSVGDVFRQS